MGLALINLGILSPLIDLPAKAPEVHAIVKTVEPVSQPKVETQTVAKEETPVQTTVEATPVAPPPVQPTQPVAQTPAGTHDDWLIAAGITDTYYANALISMENGSWDPCKLNGGAVDCTYVGNRAYGIPQALPGSKMASAGDDWQTNPITQLKWMKSYVEGRYGSFAAAVAFHEHAGWY